MEYAGFWKRFWAMWIDVFAILPIVFIVEWLSGFSREVALLLVIPSAALGWFYNIYFHGRWGATLGKMAVKIKVVDEDNGTDIGFRQALMRFSPDALFAVLYLLALMTALHSISSAEYSGLSWLPRHELLQDRLPAGMGVVETLMQIWVWSELVVLLFNKRRRAIHDFIAGTVVIHKASQPGTEPAYAGGGSPRT